MLVLGAAATAFVAWIAYEARTPAAAVQTEPPAQPEGGDPGVSHAVVLSSLRPGFPRSFAERKLSVLPAPVHEPVDTSGPTPVCRVRYQVHLIHPVRQWQDDPAGFVPGSYLATLEYDGAVVGQPLTRITLTPAPRN